MLYSLAKGVSACKDEQPALQHLHNLARPSVKPAYTQCYYFAEALSKKKASFAVTPTPLVADLKIILPCQRSDSLPALVTDYSAKVIPDKLPCLPR